MSSSWSSKGFLITLGISAGLLIGNITQMQHAEATATSAAMEGLTLATGSSNSPNFEFLWILDDTGVLSVMSFGQNRAFQGSSSIDLKDHGMKGKGGKKSKFAMVTGRLQASGQNVDACFVAEASQKNVVMVLPNPAGRLEVVYSGPVRK